MFAGNRSPPFAVITFFLLVGCSGTGPPARSSPEGPVKTGDDAPVDSDDSRTLDEEGAGAADREFVFTFRSEPAQSYSTRHIKRRQHDAADLIEVLQIDKKLVPDERLDRAASDILAMTEQELMIPPSAIVEVLWWHGLPETEYKQQIVGGVIGLGFEELIKQWFEDQTAFGADQYGIAAKEVSGQRLAVLLALKNQLDLDAVPRSLDRPGVLRLSGRVHKPNETVSVFATSPSGRVVEPESAQKRRRFNSSVQMNEAGIWQIELIGDGPNGPRALANFPVAVAAEHDRRISVHQAALESRDARDLEQLLFGHLNNARAAAGSPAIGWAEDLADVARKYSNEMLLTGQIQHVSALTGSPTDRVEAAGLSVQRVSENIALSSSAYEAHQGLMRSPAHRTNILNSWATEVGIGVAVKENQSSLTVIVTQLFVLRLGALSRIRSPQKAVELINGFRSEKKLSPLSENPWLSEFAQEIGRDCFSGATPDIPITVSPFEKITKVSFVTNNTAAALRATKDFFDANVTDIGIDIVESSDPKLGKNVVCVIALLGQR